MEKYYILENDNSATNFQETKKDIFPNFGNIKDSG
jgi:hypothetical protein